MTRRNRRVVDYEQTPAGKVAVIFPPLPAYSRHNLGGGNALRAVSRTKRAAASRSIGKAPGKAPGPARWRAHERRQYEILLRVAENAQEREAA